MSHATHTTAHTALTTHGYVLAHLANTANAGAAKTAVQGVPMVVDVQDVSGGILAYIELPGSHGPKPDRSAHQKLEAVENRIQNLPPGQASYFDWTRHW